MRWRRVLSDQFVAGTSSRSFYKGILMWKEETRIIVGFHHIYDALLSNHCVLIVSFLLTPVVNDCRWRRAREKRNQRLLVPQMMVRNVPLA